MKNLQSVVRVGALAMLGLSFAPPLLVAQGIVAEQRQFEVLSSLRYDPIRLGALIEFGFAEGYCTNHAHPFAVEMEVTDRSGCQRRFEMSHIRRVKCPTRSGPSLRRSALLPGVPA